VARQQAHRLWPCGARDRRHPGNRKGAVQQEQVVHNRALPNVRTFCVGEDGQERQANHGYQDNLCHVYRLSASEGCKGYSVEGCTVAIQADAGQADAR
jgi:hypothetical protein